MSNELKTILFLHILFALLFVGGGFAVLVLLSRARRTQSVAALRATLVAARTVATMLVLPSGVLVGILGFVLAARPDAKLGFDQAKAGWMQIAELLWLIALVAVFFLGRGIGQTAA